MKEHAKHMNSHKNPHHHHHAKMKSMISESHHNTMASERELKSGEMRKVMAGMVGKITEHR